jgi:hypothetical protein
MCPEQTVTYLSERSPCPTHRRLSRCARCRGAAAQIGCTAVQQTRHTHAETHAHLARAEKDAANQAITRRFYPIMRRCKRSSREDLLIRRISI